MLADYRAAQALAEAESVAVAQHRQQVLTRMVQGARVQAVPEEVRTVRHLWEAFYLASPLSLVVV